jgi:hypothetical protein
MDDYEPEARRFLKERTEQGIPPTHRDSPEEIVSQVRAWKGRTLAEGADEECERIGELVYLCVQK